MIPVWGLATCTFYMYSASLIQFTDKPIYCIIISPRTQPSQSAGVAEYVGYMKYYYYVNKYNAVVLYYRHTGAKCGEQMLATRPGSWLECWSQVEGLATVGHEACLTKGLSTGRVGVADPGNVFG